MASEIVWSQNAVDDLERLKVYLESNWPETVLTTFLNDLVNKLRLIETFPEIGRPSATFINRRRITVTKHNILIYSVQGRTILIEAIFDTRQSDEKLEF